MPTDERILGFSNRWYSAAITTARLADIRGGRIRLITAPYFIATKFVAFHRRGKGDVGGSHDLEDAIAVIDGRAEIVGEVAESATDVRDYIAHEVQQLLQTRAFLDALPGFLLPDAAAQTRLPSLLEGIRVLADPRN